VFNIQQNLALTVLCRTISRIYHFLLTTKTFTAPHLGYTTEERSQIMD